MLLILVVLLILFLSVVTLYWGYGTSGEWYILPIVSTMFSSVALICIILHIFMSRADCRSNIRNIESYRNTIAAARANGDEIERSALLVEIANWNSWLAEKQYTNTHHWDIFVPDEIMFIKPLQ